jgi:hypothetical protein
MRKTVSTQGMKSEMHQRGFLAFANYCKQPVIMILICIMMNWETAPQR